MEQFAHVISQVDDFVWGPFMLVLLVEKVLVYEKNRVEIIFRFKDEFETTMNYIRTMERCGRLTPSKEADERVVV